jgi:hypothetical protein
MPQLGVVIAFIAGVGASMFAQQALLLGGLDRCPPCPGASRAIPDIAAAIITQHARAQAKHDFTQPPPPQPTPLPPVLPVSMPPPVPPALVSVLPVPAVARGPLLAIAINTIPRDDGAGSQEDYLARALASIETELAALSDRAALRVFVLNFRPGQHGVFDDARARLVDDERFVFAETTPEPEDAVAAAAHAASAEGAPADEPGLDVVPIPGTRNRQQTRDVVKLSTLLLAGLAPRYVMYMEDDFVMCDGALGKIMGLLAPGMLRGPFTAIRVSYGLSGIVMATGDVPRFAAFVLEKQFHRPVDILAYYWFGKGSSQRAVEALEWFGAERSNLNYRHNLLNHIGAVSTYPGRAPRQFAACGEVLVVWSLHKHERFDLDGCPGYMVSPCDAEKLVAAPELTAGEKIPHTAPWEVG